MYHNTNLDKLFKNIQLRKQYINKLKSTITELTEKKKKESKSVSHFLNKNKNTLLKKENSFIKYIIDITFSRTNTLLHVMDFSGTLVFFLSAGLLEFKGKRKRARFVILKELYKTLVSKLKILKGQPVALHLKNVGSLKYRIVRLLKKRFYIKTIKNYTLHPHNGCRKKKMKRKKFK